MSATERLALKRAESGRVAKALYLAGARGEELAFVGDSFTDFYSGLNGPKTAFILELIGIPRTDVAVVLERVIRHSAFLQESFHRMLSIPGPYAMSNAVHIVCTLLEIDPIMIGDLYRSAFPVDVFMERLLSKVESG